MMHVPTCETNKIEITPFSPEIPANADFDTGKWIYIPGEYTEYRYILGTKGQNPLICIGINPSTAEPGNLDPTLKSVERIALCNGFDSFIMFNVYAQRATSPDDMDRELNPELHAENMKAFEYIMTLSEKPAVWAAWGTIIEKRPYLKKCLADMVSIGKKYNARWVTAGQISKKGHPHHPLYLKSNEQIKDFDINTYII